MRPLFLTLVTAASVVTSLHDDRRLRCDCHLNQVNYHQIDLTCGYNATSSQHSGQQPQIDCSKDIRGRVPRGYEHVPGAGLYKLFRTGRSYEQALARCRQDGAELAVPGSAAEARAIADIVRRNPAVKEAFVGINDLRKTGTFKSIRGTPIHSLGYHQWSPGQPDNNGPFGEQCVTINAEGLYNDNRCDWVFAFVCQRSLLFVLPAGYKYVPQLGFYKHYTTADTYEGAKKRCLDDGGHLAVLDTQEEAEEVIKYYDVNKDVTESYVGLNDIEEEGAFVSETGKLLTWLSFANWYPGEPNNAGPTGEDCVTLYVAGTYNDVDCRLRYPFFCEIPLPSS
ncbi:C-type mannose receptor 2-like [Schistocerca serialis cubense]|uniref:C-type mannose receptor 2-like n=1 Tax=Schistocerca serialis cubense TaxID=2023355 RepID=UPI00214F3A70|nr:C-type mannose receptor 2-like [Schistocerca serialis cubense]XP_049947409.1 C-type mannose receptor 2-like [Schistocerca serialis cubense]